MLNFTTSERQSSRAGGKQRIEKQHAAGKLTARERVEELVDRGSFQEIGLFAKHRATYFGMADKELLRRDRREEQEGGKGG